MHVHTNFLSMACPKGIYDSEYLACARALVCVYVNMCVSVCMCMYVCACVNLVKVYEGALVEQIDV
jgi:hypothetical protein